MPRTWLITDSIHSWQHATIGEELWSRGEPRGPQYMNVNWIGPTIMEHGSEAQKREHLPRIAAGDVLWCQGFSEPEAGSDLVALRTLALRDGDDYVVNGSKIWTSYCDHADYCFLLVRSDPDSSRHRGISVLLMPMSSPGVEIREIPAVVGEKYFHEVFLSDVRVPISCPFRNTRRRQVPGNRLWIRQLADSHREWHGIGNSAPQTVVSQPSGVCNVLIDSSSPFHSAPLPGPGHHGRVAASWFSVRANDLNTETKKAR